jgi:transposase
MLIVTDIALISPRTRTLIEDMQEQWRDLDRRITAFDNEFKAYSRSDKACRLLVTIPGVGPLNATAFVAAIGCAGIRPWPGSCRLAWSGASTNDNRREAQALGDQQDRERFCAKC